MKTASKNVNNINNGKAIKIEQIKEVIMNQNIKELDKLLTYNPDLNLRDKEKGATALHYAIKSGNYDIIKLLIDFKADVNAQDTLQNTPLHWLVEVENNKNKRVIVDLLIDKGININIKNRNGYTALQLAKSNVDKNSSIIHRLETISKLNKFQEDESKIFSKTSPSGQGSSTPHVTTIVEKADQQIEPIEKIEKDEDKVEKIEKPVLKEEINLNHSIMCIKDTMTPYWESVDPGIIKEFANNARFIAPYAVGGSTAAALGTFGACSSLGITAASLKAGTVVMVGGVAASPVLIVGGVIVLGAILGCFMVYGAKSLGKPALEKIASSLDENGNNGIAKFIYDFLEIDPHSKPILDFLEKQIAPRISLITNRITKDSEQVAIFRKDLLLAIVDRNDNDKYNLDINKPTSYCLQTGDDDFDESPIYQNMWRSAYELKFILGNFIRERRLTYLNGLNVSKTLGLTDDKYYGLFLSMFAYMISTSYEKVLEYENESEYKFNPNKSYVDKVNDSVIRNNRPCMIM